MLEAQEQFPVEYMHKFIGKNSQAFLDSLAKLEGQIPKLKRQSLRASGSQIHLAVTYILPAESADEVILLLQETEKVIDLVMVL